MPESALGLVNLTPHDVVLDLGGGETRWKSNGNRIS